jgi:hypothetical protein
VCSLIAVAAEIPQSLISDLCCQVRSGISVAYRSKGHVFCPSAIPNLPPTRRCVLCESSHARACHRFETLMMLDQVTSAEAKEIVFDNVSRARLQAGINKVADAVGVTLGPRGVHHSRSTSLAASSCGNLKVSVQPSLARTETYGPPFVFFVSVRQNFALLRSREEHRSSCSTVIRERDQLLCGC